MLEQAATLAHLLKEALQCKPDAIVHIVLPQKHGTALDVVPSVSRQLGAERQRQ